jgi:hypothetical protein
LAFARLGAGNLALVARAEDVLWDIFNDATAPPGLRFRAAAAILAERERLLPERERLESRPSRDAA